MATENGRKTKDAAIAGQTAAGSAMMILFEALAKGSADPVDYVRAIGAASKEIQAAHGEFETIIDNCTLAAVRGPYSQD